MPSYIITIGLWTKKNYDEKLDELSKLVEKSIRKIGQPYSIEVKAPHLLALQPKP